MRVQLTYCDDVFLLEVVDLHFSQTRWSWLAASYTEAVGRAEKSGLQNGRMRDFPLGPMNPYFSFDTLVSEPKEAFRGFVQSRLGFFQ
jgi:hypothetical protein